MKKNKLIYPVLLIIGCLFLFPNKSFADESSNLGYTVVAVLNGKQIDPGKSYFYIQTTPGEEQVLKVKVKSTQKEPIKVKMYTTNAFTGNNGTIEYTEDKRLLDTTLSQPISSIVKVETPSLTVEKYEEKEVLFKLTPPEDSYKGVKMGALVFEKDDSDDEKQVSSKFAYRIGLITSETGDDYKDSKTLNILDAKSTLKRGKKMILATLQNPEPKILSELEIVAEVREKGQETVLKKRQVDNYMLAPNSKFDFEMDWGTRSVKAGTYILTMNANNGYSEWSFEKEFEITAEQAKKMNEESSFKIITPIWIKGATILCFILMGIITLSLLVRRKKMEIAWKKRRKKRKKKEGK
ncbi:DUF916 and DUF3324 domain-containing protein [Candidatus Enterococcus ikei]|uniref:DUF916 and DUF3324 domain-containing protein n=1 Tax=Candidatus Enterococcus ikei TaxID=2815326 RepID=A0ABS3H0R4_9ENTE|nr:DUF916 and DUF3324 domain-containing protein [Enterococcus sp. DIV0869a]MBO0441097.1 DUF916 and DUF3324 domain-containing protein [Enterococcus sp. DIV0869a]